jgi:hypothetical protein
MARQEQTHSLQSLWKSVGNFFHDVNFGQWREYTWSQKEYEFLEWLAGSREVCGPDGTCGRPLQAGIPSPWGAAGRFAARAALATRISLTEVSGATRAVVTTEIVSTEANLITHTPWGNRSVLTGKFAGGARIGSDGIPDFAAHITANGGKVLGTQISVWTPFGVRVTDCCIEIEGKRSAVELKSTLEEFNKNITRQSTIDTYINRFGANAFGPKAAEAGIIRIDNTIKIYWPAF